MAPPSSRGCGGAQSSRGEDEATRVALPRRRVGGSVTQVGGPYMGMGWVGKTTSGEKIISFLAETLSKLRFLWSFHLFGHHAT
jgi:hypothetical protein